MSSSAEADGEEHRELGVQEAAGDLQVHQVRKVLSAGNFVKKAPEARMRGGTEAELSNLREKVHAQVQTHPSHGCVQKKT